MWFIKMYKNSIHKHNNKFLGKVISMISLAFKQKY